MAVEVDVHRSPATWACRTVTGTRHLVADWPLPEPLSGAANPEDTRVGNPSTVTDRLLQERFSAAESSGSLARCDECSAEMTTPAVRQATAATTPQAQRPAMSLPGGPVPAAVGRRRSPGSSRVRGARSSPGPNETSRVSLW